MRSFRKLVLTFLVVLILFVAANYAIWISVTRDLITDLDFDGGDLARMGYIHASKLFRHNTTDLPRRHIPLKEYDGRPLDMVVVGDSFSNGGAGGYNRYYQDYLASHHGIDILNIPRHKELSPLASIAELIDSGFLRRSGARYLLLGVSEKSVREMSGSDALVYPSPSSEKGKAQLANYETRLPRTVFINNGNFKYLLNALLYRFSPNALISQVYRGQLISPLFSAKDRWSLLYLRYRDIPTHDQVAGLNDNLNRLAQRLGEQGITLIFMPCVDKYNLYHPYLKSAPFAPSNFFEELRPMTKQYLFVDTKKILSNMLQAGETDVYYPDDTHWSWKASRKIAGSLQIFKLAPKGFAP